MTTPLFGAEIPVLAHHLAQPDKGTGVAMVSTWGDVTDVVWWRELDLPARAVMGTDGRLLAEPGALDAFTDAGRAAYAELAGKTVFSARQRIVELLRESGDLIGDPKPITHPVKFFEKGDKPLEIVSTRQWYITNGARDEALREKLLAAGRAIDFHPDFMRVRYENWVGGLSGDWLISRQRFFGVPIPVWYPLDADGNAAARGADRARGGHELPVDPSSHPAPGFAEDQRGEPGGFVGELDIMDTWATSSLTPQIAGGWETDPELFDLVFPYSLRSQGQDIIRTWLFSTVLRAQLEHGELPWTNAGISGFIVDPDRKKMSKSKGNVVTPAGMLEEHGSDAVRYWAASSRLGTDAAFDPQNPKQIKIGRRLAIKVLNAAKFVYSFPLPAGRVRPEGRVEPSAVTTPLDLDMLAELARVVETATKAYDEYDHARALEATEQFFWTFCDDYLELVKERAYTGEGAAQASAVAALRTAVDVMLRLLAPVIPFATEEVWSWTHEGSVHTAAWPTVEELGSPDAPRGLLPAVSAALIGIRRAKTDAKASQKTDVLSAVLAGPDDPRRGRRRPAGGRPHRPARDRRGRRDRGARRRARGAARLMRARAGIVAAVAAVILLALTACTTGSPTPGARRRTPTPQPSTLGLVRPLDPADASARAAVLPGRGRRALRPATPTAFDTVYVCTVEDVPAVAERPAAHEADRRPDRSGCGGRAADRLLGPGCAADRRRLLSDDGRSAHRLGRRGR